MKWMKTLGLGVLFAGIAAVIGLGVYTRSADPRAWRVAAEVWRLNQGLVSIQNFDWRYLKHDSGKAGLAGLEDLKRHGATDDIRITAVFVLDHYKSKTDTCDYASCGTDTDMKTFKPSARALSMRTDLRPGQSLPHDFIIDTAYSIPKSPNCVLRMQDFDGDGQDEVYLETTRLTGGDGDTGQEDESRSLLIFRLGDKGWERMPRIMFYNFDARTYPQRPFIVEPITMDSLRINDVSFRFVAYPTHIDWQMHPQNLQVQIMRMRPLGRFIDQVPVLYTADAHIPLGLDQALSTGAVDFTRIGLNKQLPVFYGSENQLPPVQYTRPSLCQSAADCHAIVADLDHDGGDEVILIADPEPENKFRPFDATLFKAIGQRWQVMANVELCKEYVPDLAEAEIEILPSKWKMIRLGQNLYPIMPNPGCDNGIRLK